MASLQTRLLIAVSCVSAAAIAGVAFWARQTTRVEFERFTMEQRIESRNADSALERLARVVDGRCCATIEADVQKAGLGQDRVVLVFDENGKLIVAIGRDLVRSRTTAALKDGQIRIHAEMEDVDSGAHTVLSLNGTSQMFTTRTATGATVTLASFPWRRNDRMSAGGRFLGSIDRGLVFAAAACVALGPRDVAHRASADPPADRTSRRDPGARGGPSRSTRDGFRQG